MTSLAMMGRLTDVFCFEGLWRCGKLVSATSFQLDLTDVAMLRHGFNQGLRKEM